MTGYAPTGKVFDKIVSVITNIGDTIKNVFSDGNIGAARDKIQELFGDKGAAVFDTFVNVLGTVKNAVSEVVGFITTYVVPVAEQVLQVIVTQVIPGIVSFIQAAAPTIMQIIQSIADFIGVFIPVIGSFIAGIMPIISEIITFISTYVLPIISELFSFICSTVLPAISAAIQAILPVVTNVLQTLLPAIQTALTTIWNIVSPIIQGILAAIQFAMPTIQSIVQSGVQAISGVISGIATVLNGIITFITGVFSGNWRQAWEGIKQIFSGIWQGIKSVCTGVINGIISAVNTVIRGLNKVKVPDWVPGVGGKGINISEIPMLAKGSKNTPDTFIAGEAGPELITNAPGRTVFTADQTRNILFHTFIEFIRAALEGVEFDFSYQSVFRFLRSGLAGRLLTESCTEQTADEDGAGAKARGGVNDEDGAKAKAGADEDGVGAWADDEDVIDRLENYVLAKGIRGRKRWSEKWTSVMKRDARYPEAAQEEMALLIFKTASLSKSIFNAH